MDPFHHSTARQRGIALLIALALPAVLRGQQAELTRILDSARRATKLPAIAAAIVTRDSVLAYDAVGVRRLGDPTPVTRHDVFHIGSDAKAMTAGLVGLLVDDGRLTWDATLPQLFPEMAVRMRPEYRSVTLRDLLTHRSGLVANPPGTFGERTARKQRERFVPWVLTQPPASPRGTGSYANSNYILVGAIVERLTGETYEDLIVRRLLAPLRITTITFTRTPSAATIDQPWGHEPTLFGLRPRPPDQDNAPLYGPAGRASLSIYDWGLWAQAMLRALGGGPSPWKPATAATLATPVGLDSTAMGWAVRVRQWAGGRMLSHLGSNNRHYAAAYLAPEAGVAILVAINQGGDVPKQAQDAIAGRLVRLWQSSRRPP